MDVSFIDFFVACAIVWFCWLGKKLVDLIERDLYDGE